MSSDDEYDFPPWDRRTFQIDPHDQPLGIVLMKDQEETVEQTLPGTQAQRLGIQEGSKLISLNDKPVCEQLEEWKLHPESIPSETVPLVLWQRSPQYRTYMHVQTFVEEALLPWTNDSFIVKKITQQICQDMASPEQVTRKIVMRCMHDLPGPFSVLAGTQQRHCPYQWRTPDETSRILFAIYRKDVCVCVEKTAKMMGHTTLFQQAAKVREVWKECWADFHDNHEWFRCTQSYMLRELLDVPTDKVSRWAVVHEGPAWKEEFRTTLTDAWTVRFPRLGTMMENDAWDELVERVWERYQSLFLVCSTPYPHPPLIRRILEDMEEEDGFLTECYVMEDKLTPDGITTTTTATTMRSVSFSSSGTSKDQTSDTDMDVVTEVQHISSSRAQEQSVGHMESVDCLQENHVSAPGHESPSNISVDGAESPQDVIEEALQEVDNMEMQTLERCQAQSKDHVEKEDATNNIGNGMVVPVDTGHHGIHDAMDGHSPEVHTPNLGTTPIAETDRDLTARVDDETDRTVDDTFPSEPPQHDGQETNHLGDNGRVCHKDDRPSEMPPEDAMAQAPSPVVLDTASSMTNTQTSESPTHHRQDDAGLGEETTLSTTPTTTTRSVSCASSGTSKDHVSDAAIGNDMEEQHVSCSTVQEQCAGSLESVGPLEEQSATATCHDGPRHDLDKRSTGPKDIVEEVAREELDSVDMQPSEHCLLENVDCGDECDASNRIGNQVVLPLDFVHDGVNKGSSESQIPMLTAITAACSNVATPAEDSTEENDLLPVLEPLHSDTLVTNDVGDVAAHQEDSHLANLPPWEDTVTSVLCPVALGAACSLTSTQPGDSPSCRQAVANDAESGFNHEHDKATSRDTEWQQILAVVDETSHQSKVSVDCWMEDGFKLVVDSEPVENQFVCWEPEAAESWEHSSLSVVNQKEGENSQVLSDVSVSDDNENVNISAVDKRSSSDERHENSSECSASDHSLSPKERQEQTALNQPAASAGHKMGAKPTLTLRELKEREKDEVRIGDRVYCEWTNGQWYWGRVTNIVTNKYSHVSKYSIRFDDGDALHSVLRKSMITVDVYRECFNQDPPQDASGPAQRQQIGKRQQNLHRANDASSSESKSRNRQRKRLASSERSNSKRKRGKEPEREATDALDLDCPMDTDDGPNPSIVAQPCAKPAPCLSLPNKNHSLQELYRLRCKQCHNCTKKVCQRCATCVSSSHNLENICLQKICCAIDEARRAQPAPGFPKDWRFVVDDSSPSRHEKLMQKKGIFTGLRLISPSGAKYYSVEKAKSQHGKSLKHVSSELFYSYIGAFAEVTNQQESTTHDKAVGASTSSIAQIQIRSSNKVVGTQVYATWFDGKWYRGTITRSMELGATPSHRYNVRFDDGHFREAMLGNDVQTEAEFRAITDNGPPPAGGGYARRNHVDHVPESNRKKIFDDQTVDIPADASPTPPSHSATQPKVNMQYTPTQLRKYRCKNCSLCIKADCGQCSTCLRNQKHTRHQKEVCLQKMCSSIHLNSKAQPAVGFPIDWKFIFSDEGLYILSPGGKEFRSVEAALSCCNNALGRIDSLAKDFYTHVGLIHDRLEIDQFLIGMYYYHEWTDVRGCKKLVVGTIAESVRDDEGKVAFTVAFDECSRSLANAMSNGCGSTVPQFQEISLPRALGGCVMFDQRVNSCNESRSTLSLMEDLPHYWSWIVPDVRNEELVNGENGMDLPRLTMVVRGFTLVLKVKESTIPGAGNGVFLTCKPLMKDAENENQEMFELQAGELLDLGIYAPFHADDKKPERVFLLKNFIHEQKCEEWSFNTADERYQFDITDDLTGDVHDLARQHIPTYVNECHMNEAATVRAEHDPEGSVHYLLGNSSKSMGSFRVPADTELEIFVNYGADYEKVRVRKGYSTLPPEEQAHELELIDREDAEYIQEIDDFKLVEVVDCIEYFVKMFASKERDFPDKMIVRALTIAVFLKRRAQRFLLELESCDEDETVGDNGTSRAKLKEVIRKAVGLVALLLDMRDASGQLRSLVAAGTIDELEVLQGQLLPISRTLYDVVVSELALPRQAA